MAVVSSDAAHMMKMAVVSDTLWVMTAMHADCGYRRRWVAVVAATEVAVVAAAAAAVARHGDGRAQDERLV